MSKKLFLYAFAAVIPFGVTASAQSIAITNARIVTVTNGTIDKGTVVIRDGLIESVGSAVKVPADARVIDGAGLTVYPGLFDALSNAGVQGRTTTGQGGPGGGQQAAQQQQAQASPSISNYPVGLRPEEAAAESLRAGDATFETQRNAGFTSALTVGRTGVFNGQSAIINLAGDTATRLIIKSPVGLHFSFATVGQGQYPGSLMGTISALRQMLSDARRMVEIQKLYERNPKGIKRPEPDPSLTALIPVLNRQMPIVFAANREMEIIRALDLAKEFNIKAIIAGGQEAWKVADRLKAQDVPVLLSLNFPKRTTASSPDADPETLDILRFRAEVPKTAGRLAQAGVKFAFQSGQMTAYGDFASNAAKAVENGLSADAAIRAMTFSGPEIFGVADRMGSIDAGKIANLVVVRGDLLGKEKTITHVFVDGKMFEPRPPARTTAGGERPPAGVPAANVPNIAGVYNVNIDVPGQPMTGTLTIVQTGATFTGTLQTPLGTSIIRDGRVNTEGFTFASSVLFGGETLEISVRGTVSGNQISGNIDSPQGSAAFTGTKVP